MKTEKEVIAMLAVIQNDIDLMDAEFSRLYNAGDIKGANISYEAVRGLLEQVYILHWIVGINCYGRFASNKKKANFAHKGE